ncbi:MAG: hypothetical protein ABIC95_03885 [archaeon]
MASPLDVGFLEHFSPLFAMILVWVMIYGIMSYTQPFGDKKSLYAMFGFMVSIFILFSPNLVAIITTMVPWYTVIFVFVLLMLMFYGMFGAREENFLHVLKTRTVVVSFIMIISVIILISSIGGVYLGGNENSPTGTDVDLEAGTKTTGDIGDTGTSAFFATLFHPKVLGAIMILLVGTFAIILLSGPAKGEM